MRIWNTKGRQWTAEDIAAFRREVSAQQDHRDAELMHAFTHGDSRCWRCLGAVSATEPLQLLREWATAQLSGHVM